MEESIFINLLDKYISGLATMEEQQLLEEYYKRMETKGHTILDLEQEQKLKQAMWLKIQQQTNIGNAKIVQISWYKRWKAVAAAVIIILMGTGLYFFISDNRGQKPKVATASEIKKNYANDVPPGGNKAWLTLADGSTIVLDDVKNGTLARQGNTKVIKLNGKLAYDPANTGATEIVYNTISTPRGGQYRIELADGTKVWLNSASSLHFPTDFVGKERRVEVTGEAYFEVAKNASMPFIVKINNAEVQVLGTHFNVNAYDDESTLKTTLLEGAIKFVSGNVTNILKPGQQSQLLKSGQVKVINGIDVEEVLAWKNGVFQFEGSDIETVMRQLSRWYNVEVINNTRVGDRFYAKIPRNTKLSDVLKALELTGKVHFEIDGRKIVVSPR